MTSMWPCQPWVSGCSQHSSWGLAYSVVPPGPLPHGRLFTRWRYNGRGRPEAGTGQRSGPVVVWACLDENCVRHVGSSYRWTYFEVTNAALTDPETVDVRVVVREHGRVLFDHATRLVQLDEWQPNGPGCEPTFFSAVVQATPEGALIQQ
jgi:hypothetical protein